MKTPRLSRSQAAAALVLFAGMVAATRAGASEPLGFAAQGVERCLQRQGELSSEKVIYLEQEPFGGEGVALTACGLIDAPPAQVWPVLRDCESYEQFLPGVSESALLSRDGDVRLCEALIDLPFPLGDLQSVEKATERQLDGGGFERRWSLERGSYRRLEGSWTLLPAGPSGERTLGVYQLDMDPQTVVPDFLLRRAQSSTAPKMFAAIRDRVR
jgi:ribosome-associated toxin RatA of RatAB toxin-antitoxin module